MWDKVATLIIRFRLLLEQLSRRRRWSSNPLKYLVTIETSPSRCSGIFPDYEADEPFHRPPQTAPSCVVRALRAARYDTEIRGWRIAPDKVASNNRERALYVGWRLSAKRREPPIACIRVYSSASRFSPAALFVGVPGSVGIVPENEAEGSWSWRIPIFSEDPAMSGQDTAPMLV